MIRLTDVGKTFRDTPVLKNLSLHIAARDRVALVGSNGAGKTTLIRCLLGEYGHSGEVRVAGRDPRIDRALVLNKIGFVPQLPPPLAMPVAELVRYASGVSGADPMRVRQVAARLGLAWGEVAARPFVKLSGGQKQKLLIAIALGRDTEVLILDEPAANLDVEARHALFALLAERDQTAMIISSHRLDEVASLVNRVIELDQGQVVLDDRVEDHLEMTGFLAAELTVGRHEPAFAKMMDEWGFAAADALVWRGRVAGPDRLRFLCMVSRYAGLINGLHLDGGET